MLIMYGVACPIIPNPQPCHIGRHATGDCASLGPRICGIEHADKGGGVCGSPCFSAQAPSRPSARVSMLLQPDGMLEHSVSARATCWSSTTEGTI